MVKILYYGEVRTFTKCTEEQADLHTLGEAMDFVKQKYGKDALKTMRASMLTLNGVRVESLKRSLPLPENAELGVFPVCCGG